MALLEHFVSITLLYFVCVCAVLSPWFVDVIAIIAIVGHLNAIGPYWLLLESNQDFLWDNRMLSSACVCVSLFIDQLFELLLSSGTDFQWQTILITLSHFHYHTNSDTHTYAKYSTNLFENESFLLFDLELRGWGVGKERPKQNKNYVISFTSSVFVLMEILNKQKKKGKNCLDWKTKHITLLRETKRKNSYFFFLKETKKKMLSNGF